MCWSLSFPEILAYMISKVVIFPKLVLFKQMLLWETVEVSWCLHNQEQLVLGVVVTSAGSENHENEACSVFPQMTK